MSVVGKPFGNGDANGFRSSDGSGLPGKLSGGTAEGAEQRTGEVIGDGGSRRHSPLTRIGECTLEFSGGNQGTETGVISRARRHLVEPATQFCCEFNTANI